MKDESQYLASSFAVAQNPAHLLASSAADSCGEDFFDGLCPREREVTGHILNGSTTKEIAQELNVSPHTVSSNIKSVFRKLDVHHREEVMAQYFGPPDPIQLQAAIRDYNLHPPEAQVVREILKGKTRPYIARDMNRSEHTINDHLKTIYRKMNIHSLDEIFMVVHSHGAFSHDHNHQPVPSFSA